MYIIHPLDLKSPDIFTCAQAGCQACLEALLAHHEGLVHTILRRQWRCEMPYSDLLQEGRIGLWRAILRFDPGRGIAFSSYAWKAIERRLWRAVFLERRQSGRGVGQEGRSATCLRSVSPNPLSIAEEGLWWEQVCTTLRAMVKRLPERQQVVVVVTYGVDGEPRRSLAAVGHWYGVSRETIRVWRNEALVQLRMPLFSARLRELCEQNHRAAYVQARALNRAWLGRRWRRESR